MEADHHMHHPAEPFHEHAHDHHDEEETGEQTQHLLRGAVSLGLGLYLVYLQITGGLGNYINLRFAWIALAGAAFAILLGAHTLGSQLPRWRAASALFHEHLGHIHGRSRWPALILLATPLILAMAVPAKPLGAAAVGGGVSFFGNSAGQGAVVAPSDSLEWSVLDWLRAFTFTSAPDRFNGKPADVTGFVFRNEADPKGYLIVSRFLMVHCTADSYAIGMPVKWDGADSLPADVWVRVKGNVRVGEFDGNSLPIIDATSVETMAQPSQVYLYQ
jgi:uncharacterized repeat protein (TIGR03943 family)